jgi:hypothetical protein
VQGSIKKSLLSDPLFPTLNVTASSLYRKVEICRPGDLRSPPSSSADVPGPWVEESQLTWPKHRPAGLLKSANFSAPLSVIGLNVSDRLLTSAIFTMQLHIPSREPPVDAFPEGFTYFERGTFFASATIPVRERIKQVKDGALASGDAVRDIAFSIFGVVVVNHGVAPLRFNTGTMTNRQAFAYIQEECEPGDVRIRHLKFAPENVSIVAFKHRDHLEPGVIDNVQIGAVAPGRVAAKDTLKPITATSEEDVMVPKFLLSAGSLITVFLIVRGAMRRTFVIAVLAWAVGMLRSLVWQSGLLQPSYWAGFGLVVLPFLINKMVM